MGKRTNCQRKNGGATGIILVGNAPRSMWIVLGLSAGSYVGNYRSFHGPPSVDGTPTNLAIAAIVNWSR
jgi:hypothetical protein